VASATETTDRRTADSAVRATFCLAVVAAVPRHRLIDQRRAFMDATLDADEAVALVELRNDPSTLALHTFVAAFGRALRMRVLKIDELERALALERGVSPVALELYIGLVRELPDVNASQVTMSTYARVLL
jgi:hypothetical protein